MQPVAVRLTVTPVQAAVGPVVTPRNSSIIQVAPITTQSAVAAHRAAMPAAQAASAPMQPRAHHQFCQCPAELPAQQQMAFPRALEAWEAQPQAVISVLPAAMAKAAPSATPALEMVAGAVADPRLMAAVEAKALRDAPMAPTVLALGVAAGAAAAAAVVWGPLPEAPEPREA